MFTYIIQYNTTNKTVIVTTINSVGQLINSLSAQYENAEVKENTINERAYIVNSSEDQKELLSLPLINSIIKTI